MGTWKHRLSEINETSKRGVCAHCGPVRLKLKKKGTRWACAVAESQWSHGRAAAWRLGPGQRQELLAAQDGVCAICREDRPLVVDHCHASGRVRGLLCVPCNSALGRVERAGWYEAASAYLKA